MTLSGRARESGEVAGVVAVEMAVDDVVDHSSPLFRIDAGVAWEWVDADAAARDLEVRSGLRPGF